MAILKSTPSRATKRSLLGRWTQDLTLLPAQPTSPFPSRIRTMSRILNPKDTPNILQELLQMSSYTLSTSLIIPSSTVKETKKWEIACREEIKSPMACENRQSLRMSYIGSHMTRVGGIMPIMIIGRINLRSIGMNIPHIRWIER